MSFKMVLCAQKLCFFVFSSFSAILIGLSKDISYIDILRCSQHNNLLHNLLSKFVAARSECAWLESVPCPQGGCWTWRNSSACARALQQSRGSPPQALWIHSSFPTPSRASSLLISFLLIKLWGGPLIILTLRVLLLVTLRVKRDW